MDKKSKILIGSVLAIIIISIAATYYRIMIRRDYLVTAQVSCDPETEACFIGVCDPETEECTGDPQEDTSYYKIITKNAKRIPQCDLSEAGENCPEIKCESGEPECEETLCDSENLVEGEACSDPEEYLDALIAETEEETLSEIEDNSVCDSEESDCVSEEAEEDLGIE